MFASKEELLWKPQLIPYTIPHFGRLAGIRQVCVYMCVYVCDSSWLTNGSWCLPRCEGELK